MFVNIEDDDNAYKTTKITITSGTVFAKKVAKNILGEKGFSQLKIIVKK